MLMMLNGQLIEESKAMLPVGDHGLLYGVGAFETLRIYERHLFLVEDHIDRLHNACKRLQIRVPYLLSHWEGQMRELLRSNNLCDAVIRIAVTGGVKEMGLLDADEYESPNTFIYIRPLPRLDQKRKLQVLSTPRQAPGGVETLKTSNYLNNVIARQELPDYPRVEGLFLTSQGYVAEGITSNLFFVKEREIFTPSTGLGILPGITRAVVIMLARNLGYNVYEGEYGVEEVRNAEEIFLTNSVQEIVPVVEFEGGEIPAERKITACLWKKYRELTHYLRSIHHIQRS